MTLLTLLEPDTAFGWTSSAALLAWIALVLSPPRARWTPWVGHPWVIPLLLMTFLFGPLGLLAFVLLRALRDPTSLKWQPGASS